MNWQPIKTAPKDGTLILGWDGDMFYICWWHCQSFRKRPKPYWYLESGCSEEFARANQPTHWMPLPQPPTVNDSLTVPMDDDLDEPLGPACAIDNPECESCQ